VLNTLMEAHHRNFGPAPPSPGEQAINSRVPESMDTIESSLLAEQRRQTERLIALAHNAQSLTSRL
jgi:hypothetical protein